MVHRYRRRAVADAPRVPSGAPDPRLHHQQRLPLVRAEPQPLRAGGHVRRTARGGEHRPSRAADAFADPVARRTGGDAGLSGGVIQDTSPVEGEGGSPMQADERAQAELIRRELSRRTFLRRAGMGALALPSASALLAACSGGSGGGGGGSPSGGSGGSPTTRRPPDRRAHDRLADHGQDRHVRQRVDLDRHQSLRDAVRSRPGRKDARAVAGHGVRAVQRQAHMDVPPPPGCEVPQRAAAHGGRRGVLARRGPREGQRLGVHLHGRQGRERARRPDRGHPDGLPLGAAAGRRGAVRRRGRPEGLRRREQEGLLSAARSGRARSCGTSGARGASSG